ncbi:unnamed protein product [Alopecurus aequalis]
MNNDMDRLLDVLLADILRRLPPRGIAACRTVCKGWRSVVDDGGLLLEVARQVPRPMSGIFVNFTGQDRPYFFRRGPTASPSLVIDDATLEFMHPQPCDFYERVLDHRNGLLLYGDGPTTLFSLEKKTYLVIKPPEMVMMPDPHAYEISLEKKTYQVIMDGGVLFYPEPPTDEDVAIRKPFVYLGKSEHGVYYTTIYQCQLQVWVLREREASESRPEWVLKHHSHLAPSLLRQYPRQNHERDNTDVSDILYSHGDEGPDDKVDCVWDFNDDSVDASEEERNDEGLSEGETHNIINMRIHLLGYHPNKEIAFLCINDFDGFAYYLDTSKLRYLGSLFPIGCRDSEVAVAHESFIYTPCEDDLLPEYSYSEDSDGECLSTIN